MNKLRFNLHVLNRRWFNFSMIAHRDVDAHLVTMRQAGTHWLKNILSSLFVDLYGLEQSDNIQDNSIIGHIKSYPKYKNIPQIVQSHGSPHGLTLRLPFVKFPKYIIVTRDVKKSLVSRYKRYKKDYLGELTFKEYVAGHSVENKSASDLLWCIKFMNEWGELVEKHPEKFCVIKYEDMMSDAYGAIKEICDFVAIEGATDELINKAIASNTKEKMAAKKQSESDTMPVVRMGDSSDDEYFTAEVEEIFNAECKKFLKHDFGYGYID